MKKDAVHLDDIPEMICHSLLHPCGYAQGNAAAVVDEGVRQWVIPAQLIGSDRLERQRYPGSFSFNKYSTLCKLASRTLLLCGF